MRRRVAVTVSLAVAVGACSASDSQANEAATDSHSANSLATANAGVTDDLCAAFAARRAGLVGPTIEAVVPLERSELKSRQQRHADFDTELERAAANTEVAEEVGLTVARQRALDEAILAEWGEDGTDLLVRANAVDSRIDVLILQAGVEADGQRFDSNEFRAGLSELSDRLSRQCDEPGPSWTSVDDLAQADAPADAQYLFVGRVDDRLGLFTGDGDGTSAPVSTSDQSLQFTNPVASPDGEHFMVTGFDNGSATLFVGRFDNPAALVQVSPTGERWQCASWLLDGSGIVADRRVAAGSWRTSTYDIDSAAITGLFDGPVPSHRGICAIQLDETTMLTNERDQETGALALWTRDAGTGDRAPVAAIDGCNVVFPQLRPGTDEVAAITRCTNVNDNGLWIVNLSGDSEPRHVLTGFVAAPSWSPNGDWILFGRLTAPDADPELWIADADGRSASKLVDAWASWPTWISVASDR